MVKHEDHESFSSPENLCLIEVTADSCGIKVTLDVLESKKAPIPIIYLKRRKNNSNPIFQFSNSVALSDQVSPLPLAQVFITNIIINIVKCHQHQAGEDVYEGDECVIMGWGGTKEGGQVDR